MNESTYIYMPSIM